MKTCKETCKECNGKGLIAGKRTYYEHDGLWDTEVFKCYTCKGSGKASVLRQLQAALGVRVNVKRKAWYKSKEVNP